MNYIPTTDQERQQMLKEIGVSSLEELFSDIPQSLRPRSFNLPDARSELEVRKVLQELAAGNNTEMLSFLGGGYYDHFIPAAVDAIVSRSEFATAYTPYQPEASQGTLQAIYEYQKAICRLTMMEIANASLYDGGTALSEAVMMARRVTKRKKVILDEGINPIWRRIVKTQLANLDLTIDEIPSLEGALDRKKINPVLDEETAAVAVQNPNFFGSVDDFSDIAASCQRKGALLIMSVYPLSLGILKTPGEMGADIVIGEGQSLGLPLSFGGPYLGFMASRRSLVRKMPGRLVALAHDKAGREGFVLTLQTREQHIRREKATSNICSNEALCALRALIFLTLLGKQGMSEVATLCAAKANYAREAFTSISGVRRKFSHPIFNEFVIEFDRDARRLVGQLIQKGIVLGYPLDKDYPQLKNSVLVAVTEKRTKDEIDRARKALEKIL